MNFVIDNHNFHINNLGLMEYKKYSTRGLFYKSNLFITMEHNELLIILFTIRT